MTHRTTSGEPILNIEAILYIGPPGRLFPFLALGGGVEPYPLSRSPPRSLSPCSSPCNAAFRRTVPTSAEMKLCVVDQPDNLAVDLEENVLALLLNAADPIVSRYSDAGYITKT